MAQPIALIKPILELSTQATPAEVERYKGLGFHVVVARPAHDSGLGPCGQHLCHCTENCLMKTSPPISPLQGESA